MLTINYMNLLNIDDEIYNFLRDTTSAERFERAGKFRVLDDAKRCICAEFLVKYSLYQFLGNNVSLELDYNEYGKPFLKNKDGFYFNISHSGNWVVVAYSNSEVGVDIEEIKEEIKEEINGIASAFFSKTEKKYIYAVDGVERLKRFTEIWTLKESYIKYLGVGLSMELDSFTVIGVDGMVVEYDKGKRSDLRLKSFNLYNDYYLSVCGHDDNISLNEIDKKDIITHIKRIKNMDKR